jgi:hypothetical protein
MAGVLGAHGAKGLCAEKRAKVLFEEVVLALYDLLKAVNRRHASLMVTARIRSVGITSGLPTTLTESR